MKTAVANFFSHREFSDLPAGSLHHLSAEPLPAGRTALLELQTVKIVSFFVFTWITSTIYYCYYYYYYYHYDVPSQVTSSLHGNIERKAKTDNQLHSHKPTLTNGQFRFPICLTCMTLECGRKAENLQRTHTDANGVYILPYYIKSAFCSYYVRSITYREVRLASCLSFDTDIHILLSQFCCFTMSPRLTCPFV